MINRNSSHDVLRIEKQLIIFAVNVTIWRSRAPPASHSFWELLFVIITRSLHTRPHGKENTTSYNVMLYEKCMLILLFFK